MQDGKLKQEAAKLEHFGVELFRQHVQSRMASGVSGEVQFILRFERGILRQIETIDKSKVVADVLPDVFMTQSAPTCNSK
jgi:hypothetical protein